MRRPRSSLQRAMLPDVNRMGTRVVRGASYQFLGIALRTVLTIGSTAILARLLTPADFGFVAMATVVTELAALLNNFGFNNLLIQRRRVTRLQFDTVFWASTGIGCTLALLVFVLSFLAPLLFGEPRVGELLRVMCLTFVLAGMPSVAWVVLARSLQFRTDFWMQTTVVALRSATAVVLAYRGFGAWSLVFGSLAGAVAQVVLAFVAVPYWPRWRFHGEFLRARWRTSGGYFGGGLLFYANMNADLVLIGRWLGASALGYYQNARSLTDEIRGRIALPLQQVLFPAFSVAQSDPQRLRQLVLRSARLMSAVVFPIGIGVAATAPELVPVLYGPAWTEMIPVLALFGVSAALRASTAIASPIFNATDHVSLSFRYNLIGTALMMAVIAATLSYGIRAVAAGIAVVSLYSLLPWLRAMRLVDLRAGEVWTVIGFPAAASLLLFASISFARPLVAVIGVPVGLHLLMLVGVGALTYAVGLHLLSSRYVEDLRALVLHARGKT